MSDPYAAQQVFGGGAWVDWHLLMQGAVIAGIPFVALQVISVVTSFFQSRRLRKAIRKKHT